MLKPYEPVHPVKLDDADISLAFMLSILQWKKLGDPPLATISMQTVYKFSALVLNTG